MDYHSSRTIIIRRPTTNKRIPPIRWVRKWVAQESAAPGKVTYLMKWVRADMLNVLKEKIKDLEPDEPKPKPTKETLYLCTFEGCNKSFPTEGSFRKHAHIHGERQHACAYPGCGKKFLDSSKLKRHQVVHTGERNFICAYEGCGKAFNLDFNLRAHMKIHSQEHYHICPYPECGKRYTQECKLRSHIKTSHEKNTLGNVTAKNTPVTEKIQTSAITPTSTLTYASSSSDRRRYACTYEGCRKSYIHEYKLNLHLKTQHPDHIIEENELSEDAYVSKGGVAKNINRIKPSLVHQMPPSKLAHPKSVPSIGVGMVDKQQWPRQEIYRAGIHEDDSDEDSDDGSDDGSDEDSEETGEL